jgi:hypothetical protein
VPETNRSFHVRYAPGIVVILLPIIIYGFFILGKSFLVTDVSGYLNSSALLNHYIGGLSYLWMSHGVYDGKESICGNIGPYFITITSTYL